MTTPDNLVEKTLWWTKWQTWFAGLGVLLAIVLGWSTVQKILVATWVGLTAGVRIPVWLLLLFMCGGAIWALRRRSASLAPSESPVEAPKSPARPDEATIDGVLWRWWPNRAHGRVGLLKPYCPHCDLELGCHEDPGAWKALDRWNTTLFCHRCPEVHWSFEGRAAQVVDLTRKIIEAGLRQEEAGRG